ncbi:MAG: hypothetical protein IJG50_01730 [Clostridia bacterium]|nr:hypothetical protein [Clostridia bacterium]
MKKTLASLIAAALILCALYFPASANDSTTTFQTAYKDISPNTEIYAVTDAPGPNYPVFGAKHEPSGVYFGRILASGTLPGGSYGVVNAGEFADESIISFYYSLGNAYSLEYWSYLFGSHVSDGNRALLINLNFEREGEDCTAVSNGTYDEQLRADFKFLSTLDTPVFLRIGGEMNVWGEAETAPSALASKYIDAYRHIAALARELSPNVALVFSPNYSSSYKLDMDSFYPGDDVVDWVGVSLYYDRYSVNGDTARDAFYGVGVYGSALLNVQQGVNLSRIHKKPLIATEGGSAHTINGADVTAFASEQVEKAMAYLPMLYPEIKAIVYSDSSFGGGPRDYTIYNNTTMTQSFDKGVSGNAALLHSVRGNAKFYTPLESVKSDLSGRIELSAYTYSSERISASWYLDGKWVHAVSNYPLKYTLNADALSGGEHTIGVVFSNGVKKDVKFTVAGSIAPQPQSGAKVILTRQNLKVNGESKEAEIYNIGGSNFFKLRDIAMLLNGTGSEFSVDFDSSQNAVTVVTGAPYSPVGGELVTGRDNSASAVSSSQTVIINGQAAALTAYNIGGNNFFKLREMGEALGFDVDYDADTATMLVSSRE